MTYSPEAIIQQDLLSPPGEAILVIHLHSTICTLRVFHGRDRAFFLNFGKMQKFCVEMGPRIALRSDISTPVAKTAEIALSGPRRHRIGDILLLITRVSALCQEEIGVEYWD